jgi:hypothetical protein
MQDAHNDDAADRLHIKNSVSSAWQLHEAGPDEGSSFPDVRKHDDSLKCIIETANIRLGALLTPFFQGRLRYRLQVDIGQSGD